MEKIRPKYYITTAIAYTSGKPHIGNTYEIVLADSIARAGFAAGAGGRAGGGAGAVRPLVAAVRCMVLILPIRRLPVLRWELSAVLLILPVWILSRILRRDLSVVLWILPVRILSRILRRDLSVILWILPVWILSVILWRDRLSVLWILICSLCFLVHIFIFR